MTINVVYIDDELDVELSKYLDQCLEEDIQAIEPFDEDIRYEEIKYDLEGGVTKLLQNPLLLCANVAIIDSKLFRTESVEGSTLTGEGLRLLLRKQLPYIETLIITQNDDRKRDDLGVLSKFDRNSGSYDEPADYYRSTLAPRVGACMRDVMAFRACMEDVDSQPFDDLLIERIRNSIEGISEYDGLTKADIDKAIQAFEEIKRLVENADN